MLRGLTGVDAPVIAAIHAASFDRAWPEKEMADHIRSDLVMGWIEQDRLAGFVIIRLAVDQAEVLTIAVGREFRHMGIGLKLIQGGESGARESGADIVFLEVAEDNMAAIALYKRAGYESFGRRPGYYKREGGRVAARLFRKNLRLSA